jgi:Spy/CpxP family protein refolding chaperone
MKIAAYICSAMMMAGVVGAQNAPAPERQPMPVQGTSMLRSPAPAREMRSMGRMRMRTPGGKWWKNSDLVQKVGITDAQIKKIEQIFQDFRLQLIDLNAALEKQELMLEPLIEADQPDEAQVNAQIDKVATARANLEKANTHMLLGIRRVLTTEQWKKLESQIQPTPDMMRLMVPAPPAPPGAPAPPPPGEFF